MEYCIGIDLGGTNIAGGVATLDGRLVLSPLVDRLGILKSMGVFGSLSAVLYIAGVVGGAAGALRLFSTR